MTATHWFFGLVGFTLILFLIAYFLPKNRPTLSSKTPSHSSQTDHSNLSSLLNLIHDLLDETYHVTLNERYISITKNHQKIALLTLDNQLSNGVRKMGDTLIINFNKLPSKQFLLTALKEQGIVHYN